MTPIKKKEGCILNPNDFLRPNEYIVSDNGKYYALVDNEGSFGICYSPDGIPKDLNTPIEKIKRQSVMPEAKSYHVILQTDGNFCCYEGPDPQHPGRLAWSIENQSTEIPLKAKDTCYAILRNDGKFVINKGANPEDFKGFVWSLGPKPEWIQYTAPTAEQILNVQQNLKRLAILNENVHDFAQDTLIAAEHFFKDFKGDPGQKVVSFIFSQGTSILGDIGVPMIGTISSFVSGLCGLLEHDPNFNTTFINMWERFHKNFLALDRVLAMMHDDVTGYWDKPANTSIKNSIPLKKLSDIEVPEVVTVAFQDLRDNYLSGIEKQTWRFLTTRIFQRWISDDSPTYEPLENKEALKNWVLKMTQDKPEAYILKYNKYGNGYEVDIVWLEGEKGRPTKELCERLFKDDGVGNIVRPYSVTTRDDVFNHWGLKEKKQEHAHPWHP